MHKELTSLQDIHDHLWKELGRACLDRHHEWRQFTLASAGMDSQVNARTVILRHVDRISARLEAYSDSRSPKVSELIKDPHALFLFWSKRLNWQLRIKVTMTVLTKGPYVENLWERVKQSASARDYMSPSPPGSTLNDSSYQKMKDNDSNFFAVLQGHVSEVDWLELSKKGHRRAKFIGSSSEWMTP